MTASNSQNEPKLNQSSSDEEIKRGKKIVTAVAIATVAISALTIISTQFLAEQKELGSQLVRFVLTLLLAFYLTKGSKIARWIAILLFLLAGIGAFFAGLILLSSAGIRAVSLIVMGAAYLSSFCALLFVPSVRKFFNGPDKA